MGRGTPVSQWRGRLGVAAAAAIGAVLAIALLGGRPDARGAHVGAASEPPAGAGRFMRAVARGAGEHAPARCWVGMEQFDADLDLAAFRAAAAPILAAGDELAIAYLTERLTELIGQDPVRGDQALAWASEVRGDELWLVLDALKAAPAAHLPAIAERLAALALDPGIDAERRTAFLAALETQRSLSPQVLDGLAATAIADDAGEAGWVAARTAGRVMVAEVSRGAPADPYLDALLTIGAGSPDAQTRSVALEMPMHADVPIDAGAAARLAQVATGDPDPDVRKVAIHDLSLMTDRKRALTLYEQAFAAEQDLCVRWALFRFAARVAGAGALPAMRRMAEADARFVADYRIFAAIYASGVVDFERVWQSLPDDDPHGCLLGEEEEEA